MRRLSLTLRPFAATLLRGAFTLLAPAPGTPDFLELLFRCGVNGSRSRLAVSGRIDGRQAGVGTLVGGNAG
jgi:hypothetical protein